MDPSPEQIAAFGAEARRRRKAAGLSARTVAEAVAASVGTRVEHQDITAWERGQYGPSSREKAEALDDALGADGDLVALLDSEEGALSALRREVAELRRLVERLGTPPDESR